MKSAPRGKRISVDVTNVSPNGLWILLDDVEHFLSFERFPWFRAATIGDACRVDRPSPDHLRWPTLDIDLSVESILHPERFPLVSGASVSPVARELKTPTGDRRRRARKTRSQGHKRP